MEIPAVNKPGIGIAVTQRPAGNNVPELFIILSYLLYDSIRNRALTLFPSRAGWLLASFIFSLILVSAQIIPFIELVKNSIRETTTTANILVWSFHPLETLNFLLPSFTFDFMAGSNNWFGQGWLRSAYLGSVPILLLGFGFTSPHPAKKYFLLLLISGLLLSFGRHIPALNFVFQYLPGFNLIRYPVKYLALFFFAVAPLVAMGVETLARRNAGKVRPLLMFGWAGLLLLAYWLFAAEKSPSVIYFLKRYLPSASTFEKYLIYHKVPQLFHDLFYAILLTTSAAVLFWARNRGFLAAWLFKSLFLLLMLLCLFYGSYRLEPTVEPDLYRLPTGNAEFMMANLGSQRMYLSPKSGQDVVRDIAVYPEIDFREEFYKRQKSLLPNLGNIYHFYNLDGYESIKLINNEHLTNFLASHPLKQSLPVLDLLGVKYLLSFYPLPIKQFTKVRADYIDTYGNEHPLKRARFYDQVSFLPDQTQVDERFLAKDFDPLSELVINGAATGADNERTGNREGEVTQVTQVTDNTNSLTLLTQVTAPAWLLLADTYYPGWQVCIDKVPGRLYRADYMLRAVHLPAGTREVEFRYWPTNFSLVLAISILSYLALIIYFGKKV